MLLKDNNPLPPSDANYVKNARLRESALELYLMRRARDRKLPKALVGEPAWDMLLHLYSEQPAKVTASSLRCGRAAKYRLEVDSRACK